MREVLTYKDFIKWLSVKGSERLIEGLFYDPRSLSTHKYIFNSSKKLHEIQGTLFFSSYRKISSSKKEPKSRLWAKTWQSDGCIMSEKGERVAIVEFKGVQNNFLKHNDIAKLFQYLYYAAKEDVKLLWICRETMARDIVWIYSNLKNSNLNNFLDTCGTWASNPHVYGPCMECTSDILKNNRWKEKQATKKKQHITVSTTAINRAKLINYKGNGEEGCFVEDIFREKISSEDLRKEIISSFERNLILVCFDKKYKFKKLDERIEVLHLSELYNKKPEQNPFIDFLNKYLSDNMYLEESSRLFRCEPNCMVMKREL